MLPPHCRFTPPAAPRRTVFIKGTHEDFLWLDAQHTPEILPGLFYLRNGRTLELGESGDTVRIGGIARRREWSVRGEWLARSKGAVG